MSSSSPRPNKASRAEAAGVSAPERPAAASASLDTQQHIAELVSLAFQQARDEDGDVVVMNATPLLLCAKLEQWFDGTDVKRATTAIVGEVLAALVTAGMHTKTLRELVEHDHLDALIDQFAEIITAGAAREKLTLASVRRPLAQCIAMCNEELGTCNSVVQKTSMLGREVVGTASDLSTAAGRWVALQGSLRRNETALRRIHIEQLPDSLDGSAGLPKLSMHKALVVCGSSGSGKTGGAVAFGKCDVVVYMRAYGTSDEVRETTGKRTAARGDGAAQGDGLKANRDKIAEDYVVKQTTDVLNGVAKASQEAGFEPFFTGTLRVVVDECGAAPEFLRGCISRHVSILQALHRLERHGGRFDSVQVVYAGTGAEKPPSTGFVSTNEKYSVVNMDDAKTVGSFATFWRQLIASGSLKAAWRAIEADASPAAAVVQDLLTSARAGALVVEWLQRHGTMLSRFGVEEDEPPPSAGGLAPVLASDVIGKFMNLNGLSNVSAAGRAQMLTYGLAVTMGAYDWISSAPLRTVRKGSRPLRLDDLLLVKYGVLSDEARWYEDDQPEHRTIEKQPELAGNDSMLYLQVPETLASRYTMTPAYRAMWRWAVMRERLQAAGATWEVLEERAVDFAAALCACVTPQRSLVELIRLAEIRQSLTCASTASKKAPLLTAEQAELLTRISVRGAFAGTSLLPFEGVLGQHDSLPRLVDVFRHTKGVPLSSGNPSKAHDGGLAHVLTTTPRVGKKKKPSQLPRVVLNAARAPGADVLVACRSAEETIDDDGLASRERREVALVQVKATKTLPSQSDWQQELSKLGVVKTAGTEHAAQRELIQRLGEQKMDVACVAISMTAESKEQDLSVLRTRLQRAAGLPANRTWWRVNDGATHARVFSVHALTLGFTPKNGAIAEQHQEALFPARLRRVHVPELHAPPNEEQWDK